MSKLKIDKATFMLIVSAYNSIVGYVSSYVSLPIGALGLALGIGNAVIVWLGIESGNEPEPTQVPAAAPA